MKEKDIQRQVDEIEQMLYDSSKIQEDMLDRLIMLMDSEDEKDVNRIITTVHENIDRREHHGELELRLKHKHRKIQVFVAANTIGDSDDSR